MVRVCGLSVLRLNSNTGYTIPNSDLSQKDKDDLLEFVSNYAKKISIEDLNEIETKLKRKLLKLRKMKKLPKFVDVMISQIEELVLLLNSSTISEEKLDKVIAALHYFIWAEDKIPDYIPVIGYLDDAYIISVVHRDVRSEILQVREK